MQGQQAKIDLKSPVDTATFDLINGDTIFSKKNAVVYKGVLSNTTYSTGSGEVTTLGKSITISGDTVSINDTSIDYSGKYKVNGDTVVSEYPVVHARGTQYIERLADNKVRYNGTVYTADGYYLTGFITSDGIVYLADYKHSNAQGYYVTVRRIYPDAATVVSATPYLGIEYGQNFSVYSNSGNSGNYLGFDSTDMRKRHMVAYSNSWSYLYRFDGMGLINDNGIVTGEPVPYESAQDGASFSDSYFTSSERTVSIPQSNEFIHSVLDNGSIKADLSKRNKAGDDYFHWYNSVPGFVKMADEITETTTDTDTDSEEYEFEYRHNPYVDVIDGKNMFGWYSDLYNSAGTHYDVTGRDALNSIFDITATTGGYNWTTKNGRFAQYSLDYGHDGEHDLYIADISKDDMNNGWGTKCINAMKSCVRYGRFHNHNIYFDTLEYTWDGTNLKWKALNVDGTVHEEYTITLNNSTDYFSVRAYDFVSLPINNSTVLFSTSNTGGKIRMLQGSYLAATQPDGTVKASQSNLGDNPIPQLQAAIWSSDYLTGYSQLTSLDSSSSYVHNTNLSWVDYLNLSNGTAHLRNMYDFAYADSLVAPPKMQLEYNESIGLEDPDDYEQPIGHPCVFANRLYNKGLYWDYGRGWYKYHFTGYGMAGFSLTGYWVTTTPLYDSEGNCYDSIIDKGDIDTSDGFPKSDDELIDTQYYYNKKRFHAITEDNKDDSSYVVGHNFSGTESSFMARTTRYSLNDWFTLQVWNGIPINISSNKTLIWSPQDLGTNYSVTNNTATVWSSNTIHWANVSAGNALKVTKIADYLFGVNVCGADNLIVENYNSSVSIERYAIPYAMDTTVNTINYLKAPEDGISSNDVYYYGSGFNVFQNDDRHSTSVLLPSYTLQFYVDADDLDKFNARALTNREGFLSADIYWCMLENEYIDEFWTHTLYSTDITYKNSKYINFANSLENTFLNDMSDTSWWLNEDVTLYPIGIMTTIYGENYISPTVDAGGGNVARLYVNDNKVFTSFNVAATVYQGSEIFTIMTSNYYFDGKSIYYLGTQSDYSQNVFTAYALGMRFLANSSSEAYFYSEWDKCLYLFTASATLQKSTSLSGMADIIDAVYSSHEQTLYILFSDGKLWCKTQDDSMIIETGITDGHLETTNTGCLVFSSDNTYTIYNPYQFTDKLELELETEWLGNEDAVQKYPYIDIIVFDESKAETSFTVSLQALNSGKVVEYTEDITVYPKDWNNNFYRKRITPKEICGNAFKLKLTSSSIKLFSVSIRVEQLSDTPSISRR